MIRQGSRQVAVRFSFEAGASRAEGWGRLLRLGPCAARLLTQFEVRPGETLRLQFDLPAGERFESLRAVAGRSWADGDGYTVVELGFPEREARLRLGRALRDLLARTPCAAAS